MSNQDITQTYINDIKRLFLYYKSLGEKSIAQIPDEELFVFPSGKSNSIAIIIKHLHGNMISRWTDYKNSDGEKDWRNRDQEFEEPPQSRESVLALWNEGWKCLLEALNELKQGDLLSTIYIRNEGHFIMEAMNRQLAHYSYHIGQISYLAKMYAEDNWESLSIPKDQSQQFNAKKFNTSKSHKHFTQN